MLDLGRWFGGNPFVPKYSSWSCICHQTTAWQQHVMRVVIILSDAHGDFGDNCMFVEFGHCRDNSREQKNNFTTWRGGWVSIWRLSVFYLISSPRRLIGMSREGHTNLIWWKSWRKSLQPLFTTHTSHTFLYSPNKGFGCAIDGIRERRGYRTRGMRRIQWHQTWADRIANTGW